MFIKRALIGLCLIGFLAGCNLQSPLFGSTPTPSVTPTPSQTPTLTPSPTPTATPTPVPEVRVENADHSFSNGDYTQARSDYQIAFTTTSDPQVQAAALWGLGRVEYGDNNPSQALEDLRQLVTAYPNSKDTPDAYFLLGEIYSSLNRYSESIDAYNAYLKLRPGLIDYYVQLRLGDAFDAAGDYPHAIAAYQAALTAPHIGDDTALKISIAQAYASSGDSVTSLGMYDAIATGSSNDYVKAQMDLLSGQIYLAQGKTDLAYEKFLHTVNNYPLAYDSYSALVALVNAGVPVDDLNRGLVDYFAQQYGYALDAFNRYISANPQNDGTVYYYMALTLVANGEYDQSLPVWNQFLKNYPGNSHWADAWDGDSITPGLAFTQWYYLNHYDDAAQTLQQFASTTSSQSDAASALLEEGRIYERANQLEDAIRVWEGIANSSPGSDVTTQALFWAGISNYRLGKYDQALLDFQRDSILATASGDQAQAYFWIGKADQQKGDASAAQTAWQTAAATDPTGYYSLRASDMLFNRPIFAPSQTLNLNVNLPSERTAAEAWVRVKFNLPADTDLSSPGALLSDPRLVRGTELWNLGDSNDARSEFEDLRKSMSNDPANSFRLGNYMLDLGLYRSAITALSQVLTLAGMNTTAQTLAAPVYFSHVLYGLYYQDLVLPAAQQNGFSPLFLFSIILQESSFEGFVISTAGARGLMQIIPTTGQSIVDNLGWPPNYTSDDLYRPLVSIDLGAHYLLSNQTYLNGDLVSALAGYNAGPVAANIWRQLSGSDSDLFLEVIRYQQTQNYIRYVYENYAMYQSLYGNAH